MSSDATGVPTSRCARSAISMPVQSETPYFVQKRCEACIEVSFACRRDRSVRLAPEAKRTRTVTAATIGPLALSMRRRSASLKKLQRAAETLCAAQKLRSSGSELRASRVCTRLSLCRSVSGRERSVGKVERSCKASTTTTARRIHNARRPRCVKVPCARYI